MLSGISSKTFDQRHPNEAYIQMNSTLIHFQSFGVDVNELLHMIFLDK